MAKLTEHQPGGHGQAPESLQTLAEYLELSLDRAMSVVMMRHTAAVCTVYIGDPAGLPDELKKSGTIAISIADEMLGLTRSGFNQMQIGAQVYRFVRTFTQVGDVAAVVFSTS